MQGSPGEAMQLVTFREGDLIASVFHDSAPDEGPSVDFVKAHANVFIHLLLDAFCQEHRTDICEYAAGGCCGAWAVLTTKSCVVCVLVCVRACAQRR